MVSLAGFGQKSHAGSNSNLDSAHVHCRAPRKGMWVKDGSQEAISSASYWG